MVGWLSTWIFHDFLLYFCAMMVASVDLWVVYLFLFVSIYFEVFLLVAFIERRLQRKIALPATGTLPRVAIVVPCFNEQKGIAATLRSLIALDYPKDKLEIIIVDDGSVDNTLAIAREFETHTGENHSLSGPLVRVFHKENGGKHTAMNMALAHTSADLIGCLDADSIVDSAALGIMAPVFENPLVAAATPGIHVKDPGNILQHMQHVEYRLAIFNRFVLAAVGSAFITPGPFSLFRTEVIRTLGAWRHGHATEDMEMALRVQGAGHLIANVPGAIVYTGTPRTIRSLFRQRVRWTYGWLRNAVDYRYMFGNKEYGNLGIIILPSAIISIFAGIYFFARIVFFSVREIVVMIERVRATGIYPHPSLNLFYLDTSTLWFLVMMSVGLILALLCAGTLIGTDKRLPPKATPLFILFYSFLVPLWLGVAVVRATFKTGVRWR
jgi:cellulose synthase/poly-beta-1,6-N-acetylglucosamine synthase-like glycosyltransferase